MQTSSQPTLVFEPGSDALSTHSVCVHNLGSKSIALLGRCDKDTRVLRSLLRVNVAEAEVKDSPGVYGRYELLTDQIRFVPHFPFEPGVRYRASFETQSLGLPEFSESLTLEFSPQRQQISSPARVSAVFPSSDALPENLLRFYVCFSNPMQRGRAETCVKILAPDGQLAPDVLYRAPVELWDRTMCCLTVLLDPGRLKRGVGPNRELGPPLKCGLEYTLAIDSKMLDLDGNPLIESHCKKFVVGEPVRERISMRDWSTLAPAAQSFEPFKLIFPRPLDWALLWRGITIESEAGDVIDGRIGIQEGETTWSFTPNSPWAAGSYCVRVASGLEDVCGNNLTGAFDKPLQSALGATHEVVNNSIHFRIA